MVQLNTDSGKERTIRQPRGWKPPSKPLGASRANHSGECAPWISGHHYPGPTSPCEGRLHLSQ